MNRQVYLDHNASTPVHPEVVDAMLPAYSYFNFGVGLALPSAGLRTAMDLLNAFQSKGLKEGNPRLASTGSSLFLARPLLPRRLQASVEYSFGDGESSQEPRSSAHGLPPRLEIEGRSSGSQSFHRSRNFA